MTGPTEYSQVCLAYQYPFSGMRTAHDEMLQMATKLAMTLGLGNDVGQASSERERTLLRSTWSSVVQLQQIAASRA